jgi:hypothetical protein
LGESLLPLSPELHPASIAAQTNAIGGNLRNRMEKVDPGPEERMAFIGRPLALAG